MATKLHQLVDFIKSCVRYDTGSRPAGAMIVAIRATRRGPAWPRCCGKAGAWRDVGRAARARTVAADADLEERQ